MDINQIISRGQEVIRIESQGLDLLAKSLDDNFAKACHAILQTPGRVVITGIGKSGHIARKVAATLSATGTPAMHLHPAEAAHGDLGMLIQGDTLIVISNSGNTTELRPVLSYAKRLGILIIGIASGRESLVMDQADIPLCLPNVREACSANIAPTTSTTLQLALGDALAMAVMDMRGISHHSLRALHPGGAIGLRLTPVSEIMHKNGSMPVVTGGAFVPDVISTMTRGGFGIAGVLDAAGRLIGVITDGDLRRHFSQLATAIAEEIMTPSPKTLPSDMLLEDALLLLNESKITAAFVLPPPTIGLDSSPVGIVHIHDFLRVGLG